MKASGQIDISNRKYFSFALNANGKTRNKVINKIVNEIRNTKFISVLLILFDVDRERPFARCSTCSFQRIICPFLICSVHAVAFL